jgi:hypothetical protein
VEACSLHVPAVYESFEDVTNSACVLFVTDFGHFKVLQMREWNENVLSWTLHNDAAGAQVATCRAQAQSEGIRVLVS